MSEIKNLKLEDGLDPEIAWADGRMLCFLGVDDVTEMRGMELTDGGNLYVPGGAETITRLGDKYVWLYSPSRSVVVGGREMTKEEEARWRDEEEVLNEAHRLRLAGWQSDQEVPAAARAAD